MYIAKSNANKGSYFNMLTGNEDVSQIYAYISQNATKHAYRELIKFRKRTNYFELLVNLLQKALTEELTQEVNEWAVETIDWLKKRNVTILGVQTNVNRKQDGVITVAGNVANKQLAAELTAELERNNTRSNTTRNSVAIGKGGKGAKNKRKIKKYKLLIPLELDISEKLKLEELQKKAIDTLYDLFPEKYERWTRRKKLRKIFMEEAAFKSQFYVVWALNNFSVLMSRIQTSSPQNYTNFMQRLNHYSYLDPQMFLFDKNNAFIMNIEDYDDKNDGSSMLQKSQKSNKLARSIKDEASRSRSPTKSLAQQSQHKKESDAQADDKIYELKDTVDILCELVGCVDEAPPKEEHKTNEFGYEQPKQVTNPISPNEFVEFATSIFNKFKIAVVVAHRGKQWTQLQNICKLMFNCINSLLLMLPALTLNNKRLFKLKDLWKSLCPSIYLAAENLLDMMFYASPIEKQFNREVQNRVNKWYDSQNVGKFAASLKFDVPLDDSTSIDLRFVKDFIFRSIQCLCAYEKWEKLTSVAMKFNAMTG